MDIKTILSSIGLDEKTASVYLSALELGESFITDLARHAEVKRPTAYLSIDTLVKRGLLSETRKGKRRMYSATHPQRLIQIARLHTSQIEDALPTLTTLYRGPHIQPKIQLFEGASSLKAVYKELYESLNKQEEALWFTRIGMLHAELPEALSEYKNILRKIKDPKIRELNYGDEAGLAWERETQKLRGRNHEIRHLPLSLVYGETDNLIFQDKLVIFSFKKQVFVIMITSEEIVKTYRALFEAAWRSVAKDAS